VMAGEMVEEETKSNWNR